MIALAGFPPRLKRNDFASLQPMGGPPRALLDTPTGVFVWDLMDAYPNSTISLALRQVSCMHDKSISFGEANNPQQQA